MISQNFNLKTGFIEDTGLKIPSRVEDNKCMVDIIQTALDLTLQTKKQMFVLFDDFGKIALRNVENMKINVLIDKETAENLSYTSSIDNDTYNKIKLSYENKDTGKREIFIAQDSANMNTWGILQYFETIDANVNGKVKADALLSLYNNKKRSLTINGAFGDVRIRAGCSLPVNLDLGDVLVKNFMIVEKVTHTFKESSHFMDLTLRGGVINA
jgi:hypothetical protein